jgi:hypothetical protein
MRVLFLIAVMFGSPVAAQQSGMIDATKLSVAELMALAAAERAAPTRLSCCDWGGLGCVTREAKKQPPS